MENKETTQTITKRQSPSLLKSAIEGAFLGLVAGGTYHCAEALYNHYRDQPVPESAVYDIKRDYANTTWEKDRGYVVEDFSGNYVSVRDHLAR